MYFFSTVLSRYLSLAFLFCLALLSGQAVAQSATIKGRITTSDGNPAAFVQVLLEKTSKGSVTDQNGAYQLSNIKSGQYILVTSFVGLQTQKKEITLEPGQTLEADFVLPENSKELSEITVQGGRSQNQKPQAIAKLPVRAMDLPQSLQTLDKQILEQQQVQTVSEALQNANGVYVLGTTGGYQEELGARGFNFGSSNTFKNGARYNNSISPEMTGIERVELLKGSNAILYGNVAAGGAINLVTKKPQFTNGGEVAMRMGSYDYYKPSLDIYGAINNSEHVAYRLNTSYLSAGSFRHQVGAERIYLNPSVLAKLGNKTEVLVEGDFMRDDRTVDYGTGAINYTIAEVPRAQFLGATWSYYKSEQKSLTATITHSVNNNWQLRSTNAYQSFSSDLFGTTRPTAIRQNGNWVRGIQRSEIGDDYYLSQLDLTGRFATGFLTHAVLVGADVDRYFTTNLAYNNLSKYDSVNIYNTSLYEQRNDIPTLTRRQLTQTPIKRFGVYAQDLINLTNKIKLLAGVRYSYQETRSNLLTYANNSWANTVNTDGAFTPRFGAVYQPWASTSVFASYANSFTLNTGVDVNGTALRPSFMDQYEAGIKNDFFNGMVSANLTLYQIVNSNLAQQSLANGNTNANIKELAGEVTSKGLELDVQTRTWHGFSLISGYSFNETKYTRSNIYIVGSKLRYNPAHTANATVFYNFAGESVLKGVNVGLGAFFVGDRYAGRSTRLTVQNDAYRLIAMPNYTQLDAHLGYTLDRLSVRLKVTNLLDKLSYYAHDDNSINPIAPRMLMSTLTYRF